ncbi:ChbG/HpnK family deacetylase [bacterium]|nr:ChbG/HpnK family deacetylase [bacterium]
MADAPLISVLIPARASAHCLESTVRALHQFHQARWPDQFELLIICNRATDDADDGSEAIAARLAAELPQVRNLQHEGKPGKGVALKTGFNASRGDWIFFVDADLPYDLAFFEQAAAKLAEGFDFAAGNRRLYESIYELPVPALPFVHRRHRLGLRFNALVRPLLGIHSTDTQCGIKAMSRRFATAAFAKQTCPGFLFDLEMYLVKNGYRFSHVELPVKFSLREQKSTVQIRREIFQVAYWLPKLWRQKHQRHYCPTRASNTKLGMLSAILRDRWNTGLGMRAFLSLRWMLTPYRDILCYLPEQGKVLDLACGHGLSTVFAAVEGPNRSLVGVDHDPQRIQSAEQAARGVPNIAFKIGDLRASIEPADAIVIIDSVHYFPRTEQEGILRDIYAALRPGGTFILRSLNPAPGIVSRFNRTYEWLAVRTGFTRTQEKHEEYRTPPQWTAALEAAGFQVSHERCSFAFFSDVLYICRKPNGGAERRPLRQSWLTADDWGMTPAVNDGILELAKLGVVRRVSIMANAGYLEHRLDELRAVPGVELGLHLDFTSSGENTPERFQFRSPKAVLFHLFNPFVSQRLKHRRMEEETERQLAHLESLNVPVSYLDSHHHVHLLPGVVEAVGPAIRKRRISRVRLPYDRALWFTPKFPLCILSLAARRNLILAGFRLSPCFYPQKRHFRSPVALQRTLQRKWEHEIIVHPAIADDFQTAQVKDSYRAERVREYHRLALLAP